jgi:ADP-heptose:LPS heptosyltransferase
VRLRAPPDSVRMTLANSVSENERVARPQGLEVSIGLATAAGIARSMYTITIAGEREPILFRELLQSLIANDLTDWRIFIQVDPTPMAVQYKETAAELLDGLEYTLTLNPHPLGPHENSFGLLENVFRRGSALNIHLADDTLAAADVTRLARWYFDQHRPAWLCMSLFSITRPLDIVSNTSRYPDLLFLGKEFNASAFVVCRNEWYRHFQNRNTVERSVTRSDEDYFSGWEWSISSYLLRTEHLVSVQPVEARVMGNRIQARTRSGRRAASQHNNRLYRVVDPVDLPDGIRAQLPVQEFVQKLLTVISQKEQIINDQDDALVRFRDEANERANSLSFALAKFLARSWCALLPAGSRRYRIWQNHIQSFAKRLAFGGSRLLVSAPLVLTPLECPGTSRAVTFQGLPRLISSKELPLRILILKVDHIGDFLVSFSALFLLREAWPDAHVTLVCGPWNVKLATQLQMFDEIHSCNFFSSRSGDGITRGTAEFRQLPLGEYDLAIDLRHDTETRLLLNHVRARYRAGFVCNPQFPVQLDVAIPDLEMVSPLETPRHALHAEARLVTLVSAVISAFGGYKGCDAQTLIASRPIIHHFDHGPVVALAPGTGNAIKQWGAARFARVASALHKEASCRFILIGGESDKADAALVAAALPSDQYLDAVGKLDISDVPLALAGADLFIGNDTGPTHMAALMGIPTVNIFSGIADINIWRAKGPNVITLYASVECAPCRLGKLEDCSYGHICLKSISEDDVITSALSLLQRSDCQDTSHKIRKIAPREKVAGDAGSTRRLDIGSLVADQQ